MPVQVRSTDSEVVVFVSVCLDGRGPFPFLVDTGASSSLVAASLASRSGLQVEGSQRFAGVGCTGSAQSVDLPSWTVGGLLLDGQVVLSEQVPGLGGKGQPQGVVGSDVWSRFGAIRLDFQKQTLTTGGPEQSQIFGRRVIATPSPSAAALDLVSAGAMPVGARIIEGPGFAQATADIRLAGHSSQWIIDTGAARSAANDRSHGFSSLTKTATSEVAITACGPATAPLVRSGSWSIGNMPLKPQLLGALDLAGLGGVGGVFGSDTLSEFGYFVLDYQGATLFLGNSKQARAEANSRPGKPSRT